MRRLLCAAALLIATPVSAQELNGSPGALAGELIETSGAAGVFEAVPSEHLIVVRHSRSGLVCRLDRARANRLLIFPQAARGEDVACDSEGGGEAMRFYATRYSFETSLDQQMQGALLAVRQLHPDAAPYSPTSEIVSDALPVQRSVHLTFNAEDGTRLYSRISVAMVGGWVIKLRYTAVAPDDAAARRSELASGLLWNATLSDLVARRV